MAKSQKVKAPNLAKQNNIATGASAPGFLPKYKAEEERKTRQINQELNRRRRQRQYEKAFGNK